jgi:hypothetical protein
MYHDRHMAANMDVDMTTDMDVNMATDKDIDVAANMDNDCPCIFGPISNVAQIFDLTNLGLLIISIQPIF